ncbi:MAG: ABC transporter permease [Ignavibacteriales bacterium]|nr:ABC transporter permease [Ignavibacteriales bacterium]
MNLKRIRAIAKKEFKHLFRDIRMLLILLLFPVFLLGVFGYAVNFDVHHIKIVVYDEENSKVSREFISSLTKSTYFDLVGYISNDSQIKEILNEKKAQCVVVIPKDFSRKFYSKQEAKIQYLIDGVDGNSANIIQFYSMAATQALNAKLTTEVLSKAGVKSFVPIDFRPIFWFNPDLKSTRFFIPGLIAMILIITAAVSVSLSLVREKERGTIEQINVSSIKSSELLIGKTLPYVLLALVNAAMILIAGYILFDVVVKGSYLLLFLSTLIFLIASTSIGILVSVVSDSQQVAFSIATMVTMLPSFILSGFVFPIESMPVIIQVITNITPAKFFINVLRAIVLRGVGVFAIWGQLLYLILYASVLLGAAIIIYNKREVRE